MAVAAPVLERNADTEEREYTREYRDTYLTDEEKHNLRIGENYARLINPESKPRDIIPAPRVEERHYTELNIAPVETSAREVILQKPYLVENARADADIFRADSPVNRKVIERVETAAVVSQTEDEDNEDLRPTQTTIQYKTAGVRKTAEEGKIETRPTERVKRLALNKKDKIVIAIAFAVIIALFALIIVNSVVISGLNSDVGALQNTLTQAETTYNEVLAEKTQFLENIEQIVGDFAIENGMVK